MPTKPVSFTDGEKLILLMLCDLHDHLKITSDTNPEFVREAIFSGNLWGLDWGMLGVFHGHETPRSTVNEVVDVLSMWERLEESYEALPNEEKARLKEMGPVGASVHFSGFGENFDAAYMNAASFLIDQLGRFSRFKGRDLNSHVPSVEIYRRMLPVYEPLLQQVLNKNLDADQLFEILKEQEHPSRRG
jgi:uncharacterized protein YfbU (UPF0304 family)